MQNSITFYTKFGWISAFERNGKICKVSFSKINRIKKSKVLNNLKKEFFYFFNKRKKTFKIPLQLEGNSIQKKVFKELKKINFGKTTSYGTIAKKFDISPRYVGKICSQNKLLFLIPCHRVIRSDGSMGGFSARGGIKLKKKLLNFEKL